MANGHDGDDREDDIPQPAEDSDAGSTGSTDGRSPENRRKRPRKETDDKPGDATRD